MGSECTPQDHNSISPCGHVVKINSFSEFIVRMALSRNLVNEMQTPAPYSWAWEHIDAGVLFGNTQEVGLTLPPFLWLNHAYILLFDCWGRGVAHTSPKTLMKHHWRRLLQTVSRIQIPHAGIRFHPSEFIMRANASLECSYWSGIKSHCCGAIQRASQVKRREKEKARLTKCHGDNMRHCQR